MTEGRSISIHLDLPKPAKAPVRDLEAILSTSAQVVMGVIKDPWRVEHPLDRRIADAEQLLATCATQAGMLRDAMAPIPATDIAGLLLRFVSAWPNASGGDLAGYGAQLLDDVIERQPCRYAVDQALRHLRQTSKFLPSIAEVLAAVDDAQGRIRNTACHLERLPELLVRARQELADQRVWEAREAQREAAWRARHPDEGAPE